MKKQLSSNENWTIGAIVLAFVVVVVAAFTLFGFSATVAPGGTYEEGTFWHSENVTSQNVQELSAAVLSLGSISVVVLVAILIIVIISFLGVSLRAFGG